MGKAVLISIQPKWCELIASGKKTVEVRKTKPKIETPFKVYIYCTQVSPYNPVLPMRYEKKDGNIYTGGKRYAEFLTAKVIGEFVCDSIYPFHYDLSNGFYEPREFLWGSCLSLKQLKDYVGGSLGYAWHISDLVIYEKPKELSEFYHECNGVCVDTKKQIKCARLAVDGFSCDGINQITRPPQSWCYVEELSL